MNKNSKVALMSDDSLLAKSAKKLARCFDLYDLPDGDTLIIAKEDYNLDCVPAIVTKNGDVFGIAFSFQNEEAISNGDHSFNNGAIGKVFKGDDTYHYVTPQGKPCRIALKQRIH